MSGNENKLTPPQTTDEDKITTQLIEINRSKAELIGKGLFFTLITAFGIGLGFGTSLGSTKKQNSKLLKNKKNVQYLHASGTQLAREALAKATLITVTGFSVFCVTVWKLSGARTFEEFKQKAGSFLPKISNSKQREGRRDFENLTELWHYLIEEDQKKKK